MRTNRTQVEDSNGASPSNQLHLPVSSIAGPGMVIRDRHPRHIEPCRDLILTEVPHSAACGRMLGQEALRPQ